MPFTPITFGNKNSVAPRMNFFNWPVTFNDRVTFVGPDSSIEFLGGRITGDLMSANWDGTIPPTLRDATATTGFYIDSEVGEAQFMGDVFVGGLLGVYGDFYLDTGGAFRTTPGAGLTEGGIEMSFATKNIIGFFSGDDDEIWSGEIAEQIKGTGATRTIQFGTRSPGLAVNEQRVAIVVRSSSYDGTTSPPGVIISHSINPSGTGAGPQPIFSVQNDIPSYLSGTVQVGTNGVVQSVGLGTATAPAFGIGSNFDDGIYSSADGNLDFTTSGVKRMGLDSSGLTLVGNTTPIGIWETGSAPNLTASTTAPNLTYTINAQRYTRIGDTVHVEGAVVANVVTTAGVGTYRLILPVAADTTITGISIGTFHHYDSSTGIFRQGQVYKITSTLAEFLLEDGTNLPTSPFWNYIDNPITANDAVAWILTYEAS